MGKIVMMRRTTPETSQGLEALKYRMTRVANALSGYVTRETTDRAVKELRELEREAAALRRRLREERKEEAA